MRAVWFGIKQQVPSILQALDSNEEAIAEIEKQLRKALGIELEPVIPIEEVKIEVEPIPTEEKPKQEKPKKLPKQKENI